MGMTPPAMGHAATKGLMNSRGAGQCNMSWYVRTRPKVRGAFEQIWSTADLICSFDGFNVFRPWHHGFMKTEGGWFHVDQGRTVTGHQCVQGMVSLLDQSPKTGGLVVIPGSHHAHEEVMRFAQDDGDYVALPADAELLNQAWRLVTCRAGDLVLWDSRCVHCNSPAIQQPDSAANELMRAAVYVCMTPRSFASEEALRVRRAGYEMHATTSHWPHMRVRGIGWGRAPRLSYNDAPLERRVLI